MPVITPHGTGIVFKTQPSTLPFIERLFPLKNYIVRHHDTHVSVAFPFRIDTIQILANSGIDTSGMQPINWKYHWPKVKMEYEMFPHAKITAARMVEFRRGFVLNEARTAKTSATVAAIDFLQQENEAKSALIIAPLSTLESVWVREISGMVPHKTVRLLHHKNKTGRRRKAHVRELLSQHHAFYIINSDGIKVVNDELKTAIDEGIINTIVVDESTEFGNSETDRWKALERLTRLIRFLYLLTGTPGGPETVYGQAKILNPALLPSRPAIWKLETMQQVSEYKWIVRPTAESKIQEVLTPAVRFRKRDVFKDMPDEIIIERPVELSPKQKMVLEILNEDGAMILNGIEVEPANAAVLMDKVLQISSGTMIIDAKTKNTVRLPIKDRVDTVLQLMKETPYKTIIIANYQETCSYLVDEFESKGVSSVLINGTVPAHSRPEIFRAFMEDEDPRLLVAHPETVQYGVELAAADKLIFWGAPKMSSFKYKQAKERLYSSHQQSDKPAIYHMFSTSVERRMFHALEKGEKWETEISNIFNELVEGTLSDIS